MYTNSVSMDVSQEWNDIEQIDTNAFGALDIKALHAMDRLLNEIEKRCESWNDNSRNSSIMISRSVTLGISLPILVSIGFSINIEFSVYLSAVALSRKKKQRLLIIDEHAKSVDLPMVHSLQQQGFPYHVAVEAVYNTNSSSVELALSWAIANVQNFDNM